MAEDAIKQPNLDVLPKGSMLIDGKDVANPSGGEIDHVYAATGKVTTRVKLAGAREVDEAVRAARTAFPKWRNMPGAERQKILQRFAQLLNEKAEQLSQLTMIENGTPIGFAKFAPNICASWFNHYAGYADKLGEAATEIAPSRYIAYTVYEPYGVVAVIVPFNAPVIIMGQSLPPALAAGNCVVVKPSSITPFTAVFMAELFMEAGGPPGVFNAIPCRGDIGEIICSHPGVDKIHLTGSVAVGKAVMAAASENLTPVTLELGGKSPTLIFNDADLEAAAQFAGRCLYAVAGQICNKGSRVLVQSGVYDKVIEITKGIAAKLTVGDPANDTTLLGPVVSRAQCENVMGFIERGKKSKGCRIIYGGERLGGNMSSGYFISPTIFVDVDPDDEIFRQEVFGPVVTFTKFETEEEAIRLANDSDFGLAGYIFTNDIKRANRVALALETGAIGIGGWTLSCASPYTGYKSSGIGCIGGLEGLHQFMHLKNIQISIAQ